MDTPDHYTLVLYVSTTRRVMVLESDAPKHIADHVLSLNDWTVKAQGIHFLFIKVEGNNVRSFSRLARAGGAITDECVMMARHPASFAKAIPMLRDGRPPELAPGESWTEFMTFDEAYASIADAMGEVRR